MDAGGWGREAAARWTLPLHRYQKGRDSSRLCNGCGRRGNGKDRWLSEGVAGSGIACSGKRSFWVLCGNDLFSGWPETITQRR